MKQVVFLFPELDYPEYLQMWPITGNKLFLTEFAKILKWSSIQQYFDVVFKGSQTLEDLYE